MTIPTPNSLTQSQRGKQKQTNFDSAGKKLVDHHHANPFCPVCPRFLSTIIDMTCEQQQSDIRRMDAQVINNCCVLHLLHPVNVLAKAPASVTKPTRPKHMYSVPRSKSWLKRQQPEKLQNESQRYFVTSGTNSVKTRMQSSQELVVKTSEVA